VSALAVFAPGKLFVIGEYAVLHGARALVTAIDAGIRCEVEESLEWRFAAPDLGFDGTPEVAAQDVRTALLAAAVTAGRNEFRIDRPLRMLVRGASAESKAKRGLGGSAASVVAILGGLATWSGLELESTALRRRLFDLAFAVHRRHQRGRGSGADVAAAVYGGWIDYALAEGGSRIVAAPPPAETRLAAVWSGVASDTARAIDAFDPSTMLPRLRAILDRFWAALARGERSALLESVSAYGEALEEMAGNGEGALRIRELVEPARRRGVAAKGSGAVGGDCAIALAFDGEALAAVEAEWRARGAVPLEASIDVRGVRREGSHA
jgi:phosphomevalonate kinase